MKERLSISTHTINTAQWFLNDEKLVEVLTDFLHPPGERRWYAVYPFGAGKIFVKSFVEKGFLGFLRNRVSPRGRKEYVFSERLKSLSISTPQSYGYGTGPSHSAVVQEWIDGKSFVAAFFETKERKHLIVALAELLKKLKLRNILHNDLHLDNVLVFNNTLYLIDLHKMKIKRSFTLRDEISNLSHALAMIYRVMSAEEKSIFFQCYKNTEIEEEIERTLKDMHHEWICRKQRRAFDNTSKTTWMGEYLYVAGMEGYAKGTLTENIKTDKKVVVERYSDHIRKTYTNRRRLKRAWKAHIALIYLNLPIIPRTYCLKAASFLSSGYICMEDLSDRGEELDRYMDRRYDAMSATERKHFGEGLADFFRNTFMSGVIHRDLKGCNIFALNDGTFRFLDVEDITFREIDGSSIENMLVQLNTTMPKRITSRDRIRFFVHLTASFGSEKKQIFRNVIRQSLGKEIVYEGVGGLRKEQW